jgi:hypothetical protein
VVWHPLAKATTQRPKARLKIDKIMAVKHSDFVARTPPVETALRFGDVIVGLFI